MANVTVKNIPKKVYDRLKIFAKQRHRSLNSEIIYNLEKSVGLTSENQDELRKELEGFRKSIRSKGIVNPDEMESMINQGRP